MCGTEATIIAAAVACIISFILSDFFQSNFPFAVATGFYLFFSYINIIELGTYPIYLK